MTVEAAIDSFISTLKSASTGLRTTANGLVDEATSAFTGDTLPSMDLQFDVKRQQAEYIREPTAPTIVIDSLAMPAPPSLQPPTPINDRFAKQTPTLFEPEDIDLVPGFIPPSAPGTPPRPPQLSTKVDYSLIDAEPTPPSLDAPGGVVGDPLSGMPPDAIVPRMDVYDGSFLDVYNQYKDYFDSDELHDLSEQLFGDVKELSERLSRILIAAFKEKHILHPSWQAKTYQQQQQDIYTNRHDASDKLDDALSLITGLPYGRRFADRVGMEVETLKNSFLAASKVAMEHREQELAFKKWAMQLTAELIGATVSVKAASADFAIRGVQIAVDGAAGALDLAMRVLEGQKRGVALYSQYNELQVKRLDSMVAIEKSKVDAIQVGLISNKANNIYNQADSKVYQAAMGLVNARIKRFQIELEDLATTKKLEEWKLKAFELDVMQYQSKINEAKGYIDRHIAAIKKDSAKADFESLKVKKYQAEVKETSAKLNAELAVLRTQIITNQQAIEAYNISVDEQIKLLQLYDEATQIAIRSLLKGIDAEVESKIIEQEGNILTDRITLETALRDMRKEQLEQYKQSKSYTMELSRQAAVGRTAAGAARVAGGAAAAAFSGLNAVAAKDIVEEA